MIRLFPLSALAAFLLFPFSSYSQNATISGTVSDASGAAIPGAYVAASNIGTGANRAVETGASGSYSILDVQPGRYSVLIERSGFASVHFDNVEVNVSQSLSLNATLQIGAANQTVEVSGDRVALIELENGQISNVVDQRRITDLPLITRNPYELVLLSPGVVQSDSGLGGFSVNGARERNNNFMLDGSDNNDTSVPGIPSGLISLNPDAVQEFRVITNNFLPEFGRNTGAVIDIITRSGTNQVHGNAYWFGRYNALAARDYFNAKTDQDGNPEPQNPFVRNDFGWSLGGPIKKDKTFFFVNTEYQRFRTTITNSSVVPTAAFKTGKFTFDGYPIDLSSPNSPNNAQGLSIDPTVQKLLSLLPNPNGPAVDDVRGLYYFPSSSKQDTASVAFKLDHRFNDKNLFFVRYSYNGFNDPNAFHSDYLPGQGAISSNSQTHAIATDYTTTFSPSVVNEFRAGVNRTDDPFACTGVGPVDALGLQDPFGVGSDYSISGIAGFGCSALGDSNGQSRRTGTWSLNDSLSWVYRTHSLKFGAEFRYIFENSYDAFNSRESVSFNGYSTFGAPFVNLDPNHPCDPNSGDNCGGNQFQDMAAGLLGFVDSQSQSEFFDKSGNRTAVDYRRFVQHEYGFYAQDSYKLRPNLTVNYGLRYQLNGVPFEKDGNLSNLYVNPAGTAPFTFITDKQLYNNDYFNFEPRFGLSWDPFKKGKTAIRGGYGIFHDRIFGNLFGNARGNPPFQQSYQSFPGNVLSTLTAPQTLPTTSTITDGSFISPDIFDPNLKIPMNQNWNFGIQQEIGGDVTVEVNYVGNHGSRELRVINGNQPIPSLVNGLIASGVSPNLLTFTNLYVGYTTTNNTAFYEPVVNESVGNSTYNGLQAKVTRRFVHGFQIQGSYTWSHAIDDASDPLVAAAGNRSFPRNSFDLHEERGDSDFDRRQTLTLNYIAELPFGKGRAFVQNGLIGKILEGWQLSGISTFDDGSPYDVFGNRDSEHTAVSARANLIGDPSIPSGSPRTQTGPLVTAFGLAPYGSPGNVGRNTFVGPGVMNTNAVLAKNQSLGERLKMQLRFEVYNVFNRPQFSQPGNSIASPGTFGVSTSTLTLADGTSSSRQIQLALKLNF